jgi:hypothetical protein
MTQKPLMWVEKRVRIWCEKIQSTVVGGGGWVHWQVITPNGDFFRRPQLCRSPKNQIKANSHHMAALWGLGWPFIFLVG